MERVTDWCRPLCAVLLLLGCAGCDGGSAQRASQFERFVGTWTASTLQVDGFNFTSPLNATYDRLEITFTASGDGLGSYELRGMKDGTSTLAVRGPVQVINDDALVLEGGFARRVFWTFEFETSRRLALRSPGDRNAGTTEFLQGVLPGQTWGDTPDVVFRLQADDA
jgi:hypothetical protein